MDKLGAINCIINDYYKDIYDKFFKPSVVQTNIDLIPHFTEIPGGNMHSPGFFSIVKFKLKKIIESLLPCDGDFVIWSDIDLIFPNPNLLKKDIEKRIKQHDLLLSSERHCGGINSGFMIIKKTTRNINFFKHIFKNVKPGFAPEQTEINNRLHPSLNWTRLPMTYWNETIGYPLPNAPILMAHANDVTRFRGPVNTNKINCLQFYEKFRKIQMI